MILRIFLYELMMETYLRDGCGPVGGISCMAGSSTTGLDTKLLWKYLSS